jgi:uncharacterized protein YegP (UPF0339 family)
MYFKVGPNKAGNYTWWLHSGSDMIAWAGEDFASKYNAERACLAFKAGASTASYEVYLDEGSKWRWRASRSSDKVAASGESFANKANAERAAVNVRDHAGAATSPQST